MLIKLRVHPDSKRNAVEKRAADHYDVWVKAPAENGRANAACLALLGAELGVPPGRIRMVKGSRSPSKIVEVP
jgi:uncharacterized protein